MSKSKLAGFATALLVGGASLGLAAPGAWAAGESSGSGGTQWHSQMSGTPINESYAKTQIVVDGYKDPTDLQKTQNGYTAKAMENGKQVSLMVNQRGDVAKQQ